VPANDSAEYFRGLDDQKAFKAGTSADGPTKEERDIAALYGFSLPPLGGEPESFALKGIALFR